MRRVTILTRALCLYAVRQVTVLTLPLRVCSRRQSAGPDIPVSAFRLRLAAHSLRLGPPPHPAAGRVLLTVTAAQR